MFLHVSVSHSVHRGGLPQCMLGIQPPQEQTPPGTRHPPGPDPPAQSMLGDMVKARAVCILLECNLVSKEITRMTSN